MSEGYILNRFVRIRNNSLTSTTCRVLLFWFLMLFVVKAPIFSAALDETEFNQENSFQQVDTEAYRDSLVTYLQTLTSNIIKLDTLLALAHRTAGDDYERSLSIAMMGLEQSELFRNDEFKMKFLKAAGIASVNLGKYADALSNFNQFVDMAKVNADEIKVAEGLAWAGLVFINQGKFDASFTSYMEALQIYELAEDERGQGEMYKELCGVLFYLERYEEGVVYGKQAEAIFIKNGDDDELYNSYQEMANNYLGFEAYDEALDCIKKAMTLAEKIGVSEMSMASLLNSFGNVYKHLKRYDESVDAYKKSNQIVRKLDHVGGLSATTANLSDVYMRQGDYKSALPYQLESYELMEKHGFHMNRLENIGNLSTIYKKLGQFENALKFREQYGAQRDSMLSVEKDQVTKELSTKYQTGQKEELISLQTDQLNKQRYIQLLTTGFLILFGALLLMLYRNFKLKQKTNAKLGLANEQLEVKNKENELLLKEIHHRVKNNLQTVSSLLSLQSESIQDQSAIDAVQESKNRVASMAMIHQKLYQRDNLAAIEMRDYFETIGKAIIDSFGEKAEHVSLNIEMSELELDVDPAVPIGLIANELITNSLKYAFPHRQKGQVSISMSKDARGLIKLEIADNGQGQDAVAADFTSGGFGTMLIQLLTTQLRGTLEKSVEEGTSTIIRFSVPERHVA